MIYISLAILLYISVIVYYRFRRPPAGINAFDMNYDVATKNIDFLYDLTRYDEQGAISEQKIFKAIIEEIRGARSYIIFDVFLFNSQKYDPRRHLRTTEMIIKELKKKDIPKFFVVDPLNSSYQTDWPETYQKLQDAGVKVIETDLDKLPDNNLLYSGFWRIFFQWFGTSGKKVVPNPMKDKKRTTLRAILKGLNAKANHRKLLLTDDACIISSSNLHDASSMYSNTGIRIKDTKVSKHFFGAEIAVAKMSGVDIRVKDNFFEEKQELQKESKIKVKPLMGKDIKKWILRDFKKASPKAKINIGMLFLADSDIVNALKKGATKGQDIKIILDNNRVSFHHKKIGLPNKFVAPRLEKAGIKTRFFNDKLNEYHSKYIYINDGEESTIHLGSANLTRRSLLGTNLENNIRIQGNKNDKAFRQIEEYIKLVEQEQYSHKDFKKPKLYHLLKSWVYFAEKIGLASW